MMKSTTSNIFTQLNLELRRNRKAPTQIHGASTIVFSHPGMQMAMRNLKSANTPHEHCSESFWNPHAHSASASSKDKEV